MRSLILLAASAVFAGGAMAAVGVLSDPNNDGKIYPDEFRASRMALLMQADTDKDGRLSRAEVDGSAKLIQSELEARGQTQAASRIANGVMFDRVDADRDGYLSQPEVTLVLNAQFSMVDTNRDGYLDAVEAENFARPADAGRP